MRNIVAVINDLYDIIPKDCQEERFVRLKHNLKKNIIESIPYSEPEMIKSNVYWKKLSIYCNDSITADDYNNIPWCKEFIDIFMDPYYKIEDTYYHL